MIRFQINDDNKFRVYQTDDSKIVEGMCLFHDVTILGDDFEETKSIPFLKFDIYGMIVDSYIRTIK